MEATTERRSVVDRQLRWLADHYEQNQRMRIETENRIRAVLQGADETWGVSEVVEDSDEVTALLHQIRDGEAEGPVPVLTRSYRRYWLEERETYRDMMRSWREHPVYPWLSKVKGIGPTLGCKLLARLNPEKAPHASSFWQYCGLGTVPGKKYRCPTCNRTRGFPETFNVTGKHRAPDGSQCADLLVEVESEGYRVAMPKGFTTEVDGEKRRAYDAYAKKIMYLVGTSFLKARGPYEQIYRQERARLEVERPGWDDGRRHLAALRKAEKLFLSHLWEVWRGVLGLPVGEPYAIRVLGHDASSKIDPWDMVDAE